MWKRGGRSSALDRAQALLSARRDSRGDAESVTPVHTGVVRSRAAPPNTHALLSDLSDLSSVSSASEHGADPEAAAAAAGRTQGGEGASTKDLRPQSSLGGGGNRFLKKAPPPPTSNSRSPVRKSQMQHPEPRNVSSSLRGSQTAALSRLAQIESRIRSRQQTGPKPAKDQTSELGIQVQPPAAAQSPEASGQLSAQSSSEHSLKGNRFLKSTTATAAAAARAPQSPDIGVRFRSRAADAVVPSLGLETNSRRVLSGVCLESDEEDMRKLLGDSLNSMDNSFLIPGRAAEKMSNKSSQKVQPTPPHTAAPPRSPTSPSRRSSPFRFTGHTQAHFSSSVLSLSPPPSNVSTPSPPGRLNFPHGASSPQRSLSSLSGCSEVLSLEELFPVGPASEDRHSEMSAVSSEDFKINVMTLDDLVPAELGFTNDTAAKETDTFAFFLLPKQREAKLSAPDPGSPNRRQLLRSKEKQKGEEQRQEEEEKEDVLDYQSDFESENRTAPDHSASQVSEHLQGHGDEKELVSEVREEAEYDYSSTFSDTSCSSTLWTSDGSETLSRSRDSKSFRSFVSHSGESRRRASTRRVLKEAAVQTQSDPLASTRPAGLSALSPAVAMAYMDPSPVVTHTLSAEMVEALSTFNPAVFALNELLKQQVATTRRFIESSRHLHSSLVKSLEPPNYRYTTLEDTKKYILKRRPPKLTVEKALEEVLQEARDHHHI
ncbi:hypothetical protein D9C73_008228 [Collichthys lucidus]|uniref:DUF4614 domain-containing protein n=1 Tax=Collichthys lucidus TaxID=240159 RepID=A0A4U5UHH2_COLLU|nr:hypothetical protein D9C73_008228 [Collichthys lucidus]